MARTEVKKNCEYCKSIFVTVLGNPKRFCSADCGYKNRKSSSEQLFHKNTARNPNGCLDFNKSTYSNGYGRISIGNNKHQLAHRFAWEMHNGPIPEGMCILHRCDRPVCCEISHLFLGTVADNTHDMMQKKRHKPMIGSLSGMSKLTEEDVIIIRTKLKTGITADALSKEFNVVPETIRGINRGKSWKHIPGEYVKSKPKMLAGSKCHLSKLNETKVKEILLALKNGINGNRLSKKYNVSRGTIYQIKNGKSWKHVGGLDARR